MFPDGAATARDAATTAYTAAGGMRAGLLADAVQGAVMGVDRRRPRRWPRSGRPVDRRSRSRRSAARAPELLGASGRCPAGARRSPGTCCSALGACAQPHYIQKFFCRAHRRGPASAPGGAHRRPRGDAGGVAGVGLAGAALVARGGSRSGDPTSWPPAVMRPLGPWAVVLAATRCWPPDVDRGVVPEPRGGGADARPAPGAGRQAIPPSAPPAATVGVAVAATALGVASDRAVALLGVAGWGFFTAALLPV